MFFAKYAQYNLQHVEILLLALDRANVTNKLKQCEIFTQKVRYLENIIELGRFLIKKVVVKELKLAENSWKKQ